MIKKIDYITDFPATDKRYQKEDWYNHFGDAVVIMNCKSSEIYYSEHWTPLSIKCAFGGREYYKMNNRTYAVQDENFLLLNDGNTYESYIKSDTLTESLTINFTPNNVKDLNAFIKKSSNKLVDDPALESSDPIRVFEKLYAHTYKTRVYINSIRNHFNSNCNDALKVQELLAFLLQEFISLNAETRNEIDKVQAKKITTREEIYRRIHIAKDYIESCYEKNICLEDLSVICLLNSFQLLREFNKHFKITPHKYLTHVRMLEAKKLIAQNKKSLVEIAVKVGYEDVSSFSRLFKNHFGMAPHYYRNQKI